MSHPSNKGSWAHKFNYPYILIPVNISRCAGIGRQLHLLKAKDLMKDKLTGNRTCAFEQSNQKLLNSQIQISHGNASQHVKGALELVINCII